MELKKHLLNHHNREIAHECVHHLLTVTSLALIFFVARELKESVRMRHKIADRHAEHKTLIEKLKSKV